MKNKLWWYYHWGFHCRFDLFYKRKRKAKVVVRKNRDKDKKKNFNKVQYLLHSYSEVSGISTKRILVN